jgi:uncharacterized repeat protein (TIGR03803 family)
VWFDLQPKKQGRTFVLCVAGGRTREVRRTTPGETTMTRIDIAFRLLTDSIPGLARAIPAGGSRTVRILAVAILIASPYTFSQTLTTLYSFGAQEHDGADPMSGIVFDKAGNIYGSAAISGSQNGDGTLFKLARPHEEGDSWNESTVHRFRGIPDGSEPESLPVLTPSGKLFGTTYGGGANGMGTVFVSTPPSAASSFWTTKTLYSFGAFKGDGLNPNHGMIAAHGGFCGVASNGGATRRGSVFLLTPPATPKGAWTETILYSFTPLPDAAFPSSPLTIDKDGNLYGTALQGGANNLGAIYEISPPAVAGGAWTETVLYSFNGIDGTLPIGRLVLDASGALYGTTDGGGAKEEGTVFKLTRPATAGAPWTETILFNFSGGSEGGNPSAGVTLDKNGRIFGPASSGGDGGPDFGGVIFVLDPPAVEGDEWKETVLHHFGGPDGFSPVAPVVLRQDGIYGTTMLGGDFGKGTIFVLTR